MDIQNNRGTPKKRTGSSKNGINLDYDYNTEYGDGDIPDVDKNCTKDMIPDEVPRRDGPGGE